MTDEITKESVQALPTKEEVQGLLDSENVMEKWGSQYDSATDLQKAIMRQGTLLDAKKRAEQYPLIAKAYVKQCEVIEQYENDMQEIKRLTQEHRQQMKGMLEVLKATGVEG